VPNSDPDRDIKLIAGKADAHAMSLKILKKAGIKPRKNAVLAIEHVCTFSPEQTDRMSGQLDDWIEKNLEFFEKRYGKGRVLQAVLHTDETTPHLHVIVSPLEFDKTPHKGIKDPEKIKEFKGKWKLNAQKWLGSKNKLIEMQDEYANTMKPFDLDRGIRNSKAKHKEINKFYSELNADLKKATKELEEIIESKPSVWNISKFAALVKEKLMALATRTMSLERQEKVIKRREIRADKLMKRLNKICEHFKSDTPENLPDKINDYINNKIGEMSTAHYKAREKDLDIISDQALKLRTVDKIIADRDRRLEESESQNKLLRRKLGMKSQDLSI
ncbi:MobV family relaxase, partial [Photobacterium rosenbergii]|uniref:MobV family relaxase n=1 Tax=Photobacterium rosenbergii TaxID=294936 RepID=UPI001C99B9A1